MWKFFVKLGIIVLFIYSLLIPVDADESQYHKYRLNVMCPYNIEKQFIVILPENYEYSIRHTKHRYMLSFYSMQNTIWGYTAPLIHDEGNIYDVVAVKSIKRID